MFMAVYICIVLYSDIYKALLAAEPFRSAPSARDPREKQDLRKVKEEEMLPERIEERTDGGSSFLRAVISAFLPEID